MYIVNRFWFKYGNEEDEVECTTKEYDTFEKAYNYCKRYAKGIKFTSCEIEDKNGKLLYEHMATGEINDYR